MSPQEFNSPWKEVVDHHLPALLAFLAPDVHADIDWSRDVESLEQEFRKLSPEGETGTRLADKLLKAQITTGDERYLHVEVQAQPQEGFEQRVYTYHYLGQNRYGLPPEAVVILADDDPNWRPSRYLIQLRRTRLRFEFDPVKIHDWRGREAELREHPNPVALFVLAHLESQRTREDDDARARVKLDLILRLHERKLDAEELRQWYRYLDWLLALPEGHEAQVWNEVDRIPKEKQVPYVTYAERRGMEKGIEQGIEKGIEQGIEKGIEQGIEKGIEKGMEKGLLIGLEAVLRLRFAQAGMDLMPFLRELHDASRLEGILQAAEQAATLDDIRQMLADTKIS